MALMVDAEGVVLFAKGDKLRPRAELIKAHPAFDRCFCEVVKDARREFDVVAVAVE